MESEVIRFKFGDFRDPHDELSQWLVAVSFAVNDTTLTIRGLVDGFDDEPIYERVYRTRLIALHMWEALDVMAGGLELEQVKALYDAVADMDEPEHKEGLERVLKFRPTPAARTFATPWHGAVTTSVTTRAYGVTSAERRRSSRR